MKKRLDSIIEIIEDLDEKAKFYRVSEIKEAKRSYDEYIKLIVYDSDISTDDKDNLIDYWHRIKQRGYVE